MALGRSAALLGLMAVLGCARPAPLPAPEIPPPPAPVLAPADSVLGVRQVSVEPKTLLRGETPHVEFGFSLAEPARVRVEILDEAGAAVHVVPGGERPAGRATLRWDGHGPDGAPLAPAVYLYRIVARRASGVERVSLNPPFDGGDEVLAQRFGHDPEKREIEFVLPRAARVRLRAGLRQFPHLATLMDWSPLGAGRHVFVWSGLDASKQIRLASHPELGLSLSAYALPSNALIVRDPAPGLPQGPARTANYASAAYRHAKDSAASCHEPDFELSFPGAGERDGMPLVGERATVRVTLDPRDRSHLINQRFEAMFFVDNIFLIEREDGTSPFSYRLDTGQLAPGVHLLTVNILSYDDHYGVRTRAFVVER